MQHVPVPLGVGATEAVLTRRSLSALCTSSSSKMTSTLLKVFLKCVIKSFLFPEKFTNPRLQETLNKHGLQVAH